MLQEIFLILKESTIMHTYISLNSSKLNSCIIIEKN